MYVLGVYDGHNATASLLKDGEIIGAVSEERFNGIKNYLGFPYKSIDWLLEEHHLTPQDIAYIAITGLWGVPVFVDRTIQSSVIMRALVVLYGPMLVVRNIIGRLQYRFPWIQHIYWMVYSFTFRYIGAKTSRELIEVVSKKYHFPKSQILRFEHHSTHAAASYYGSPYNRKKALVFTIDGEGDLVSSTVSISDGTGLKRVAQSASCHSLGLLFMEVTGMLGMKRNEHEYKVMGLAPYANPTSVFRLYTRIQHLIRLDSKRVGKFLSAFDMHLSSLFLSKELRKERFDVVAGAFQKLTEERLTQWVAQCIKKYKVHTICIGGGVAMNVKANQKIVQLKGVHECFVCPSAGDESTAIGACYLGYREYCDQHRLPFNPSPLQNLYLGPAYSNEEIQKALQIKKIKKTYTVTYYSHIEKHIATLLKSGAIVARVAGKMEWGARALGNRSILAHPSKNGIVQKINQQLKMRDFWMPFSPSILETRTNDYFLNPKNIASPFMMMTFTATQKGIDQLQNTIHVYDRTMRAQVVTKTSNKSYWKILHEFEKITHIGGILNTSFNLHGKPVVNDPIQALEVFENSGLEYLALENYLISKNKRN